MEQLLQLNVYQYDPQYPVLTDNDGMLFDIFGFITEQMNTTFNYTYVKTIQDANVILNINRNFDTEKGVTLINDDYSIDYSQFDITNSFLQENYVFIYPSLLVTLFTRIIWELFINYLLIIFPWVMLNANLLIFSHSDKKSYGRKIITSLQLLLGNEPSNLCQLLYKIFFYACTFLISAIIFIDFIYVIGNTIQRQNFNSLNDLAMNQFKVCFVEDDKFIESMTLRYRHLDFISKSNIQSCIDLIAKSEDYVFFVSEFKYGTYLKVNPQFNNFYKYALKQNSYKSYFALMNLTLPSQFRFHFNQTIQYMQNQKFDLEIRGKYLVQIVYVKQALVSLIFSNKTFLLVTLGTSLILFLFIQCSILSKQYKIFRKKLPFKFKQDRLLEVL